MKIGLIGLNQTGKTTLFDLLTGRDSGAEGSSKGAANIGVGYVPDERVDFLSAIYNPKKTTYAKIELTDVAGFSPSLDAGNSGAAKFLNDVRPCDAIVHVLRAFDSDLVLHELDTIDPARDLEAVETEMLFADLDMIEKRIARINAGKKLTKENSEEIKMLERCSDWLVNGGSMRDMELTDEEHMYVRGFAFLTEKPRLVVVNVDEDQWVTRSYPNQDALTELCDGLGIPVIVLCAEIELEISRLPDEDKQLFIEDMGISQPGIETLAKALYGLLGLISFLTVGDDEVRAWTIEEGTIARKAAGKIHTDIERGFIRAEVVKFESIHELGTMVKVKEKGLFRLEGKEYVVLDGDIIQFRFNV
ncbi:MAG: redox-regulated ATPase YchF [Oscillospiraceae bacterium]|nr:redox-regulated ATPase YchF [Oscillospiraceae bacterium]